MFIRKKKRQKKRGRNVREKRMKRSCTALHLTEKERAIAEREAQLGNGCHM
jgi:hypothetical protein